MLRHFLRVDSCPLVVENKVHSAYARAPTSAAMTDGRLAKPSDLRRSECRSHYPFIAPATLTALPSSRAIPNRDVFYVAFPKLHSLDRAVFMSLRCLRARGSGVDNE